MSLHFINILLTSINNTSHFKINFFLFKFWTIQLFSEWHIPEVVFIQLTLLTMSTWLLETCIELE